MDDKQPTQIDRVGRILILVAGVAVGYWVAFGYLGLSVHPPINHCPDSDIACPSSDLRNIIPAAVAGIVAISVSYPTMYAYDRVVHHV